MWELQIELITIFKNHGVPKWIKVDNGRPFGDPLLELIPVLSLWLIGLGIKVIWNPPASPQENDKVERSQGVMGRWTEYNKCKDHSDLQQRLWKEAHFHNYHFPIRRLGKKTRCQLFPKLAHTGSEWNPAAFKLKRILIFLAKASWERKVSTTGQIALYGQRYYVGNALKHQKVSIKLNPRENKWHFFDATGTLVKKINSPFTDKNIWRLDFS